MDIGLEYVGWDYHLKQNHYFHNDMVTPNILNLVNG